MHHDVLRLLAVAAPPLPYPVLGGPPGPAWALAPSLHIPYYIYIYVRANARAREGAHLTQFLGQVTRGTFGPLISACPSK